MAKPGVKPRVADWSTPSEAISLDVSFFSRILFSSDIHPKYLVPRTSALGLPPSVSRVHKEWQKYVNKNEFMWGALHKVWRPL